MRISPNAVTPKDAEADSSVVRNARHNSAIAWIRLPISIVVSSFLFNYVDVLTGVIWLIAIAVIEALAWLVRSRLVAGDVRFEVLHLVAVSAVCLAWVTLGVVLWNKGGEVPRYASLVTLFSIAFYGVAGGYKSAPILLALCVPPLLAIFVILTSFAWSTLDFWPAVTTTLATVGSCLTVAFTGRALHQSDRGLEAANVDLRLLTERLKSLAERERLASHAKDNLLANVSHEVRTPLNGIIGLAATLDTRALSARDRQSVDIIRQSGEMLERLVSDILDAAAIDAGGVKLKFAPFDPAAVVKAAVALMEPEAIRKGLTLSLVITPGVTPLLTGDEVRIRQIILNLLYNAIKFTDAGGVTVALDCDPTGDEQAPVRLLLRVSDTGRGFDPMSHTRIFERFERGRQPEEEPSEGFGLGLAITRALLRAMNGEISVESTPLVGSTFKVMLPLQRAAADAHETRTSLVTGPDVHFPELTRRLRVLLVEDHPINRIVVSTMLEAIGAETTICANGAEAIEAAASSAFDVILMDLLMPVMDGFEATHAIRRHEKRAGLPRAAIIMLTASALPAQAEKAREAGCDAHLTKPVTPERLFEALSDVLRVRTSEG